MTTTDYFERMARTVFRPAMASLVELDPRRAEKATHDGTPAGCAGTTLSGKPCKRPGHRGFMGMFNLCAAHYAAFENHVDWMISEAVSMDDQVAERAEKIADRRVQDAISRGELSRERAPFRPHPDYYKPNKGQQRFVYFMVAGPLVKIGMSIDPERRLHTIKTIQNVLCPDWVDLESLRLAAAEPGGPTLERELHARYADQRVKGEWFNLTTEIQQHIDSLTTS